MAKSKYSSFKSCVTCQSWGGPRKAKPTREGVEYEGDQVKGECIGGAYNRLQMTALKSCPKWAKWSVLK